MLAKVLTGTITSTVDRQYVDVVPSQVHLLSVETKGLRGKRGVLHGGNSVAAFPLESEDSFPFLVGVSTTRKCCP